MCPVRMTAVTSQAVVDVTCAAYMFAVHDSAVVSMTVDAAEDRIVRTVRVARIAAGPSAGVRS